MYWEEDEVEQPLRVSDDVVDLVFKLQCKCLPVDHVYPLYEAIEKILPWL